MAVITIADTIFDNPTQNDLNPTGLLPQGGRLMSSAPHVDGVYNVGAEALAKDSANLVLSRVGKGDWALTRIAAGAETYNVRTYLDLILRTGEKYFNDSFGQDNKIAAPDKGIESIDFFINYKSGVVALTSATLRLGKTVYSVAAGGAAPTQTDLVAATAISTVNTAQYQQAKVTVPAPLVFHKDDNALVEIEAVIVMANTGTLAIASMGCHLNFNYN